MVTKQYEDISQCHLAVLQLWLGPVCDTADVDALINTVDAAHLTGLGKQSMDILQAAGLAHNCQP